MRASTKGRRCAIVALAATVALTVVPAARAAGVSKQRAASLAKRAASARVARFAISYPPGARKAACDARRGGGWRCAVGTGGQCSGVLTVTGSSAHPHVRNVDVSCFE
jgi:hypothetical protein